MTDPTAKRAGDGARARALRALVALERGRVPRLREALALDDLPARERAFALELAQGVERRRITLDAVLVRLAARGELPADPFARVALRLGAYQLMFWPRVAVHAAVHATVELLRNQQAFVNAMLRRLVGCVVSRAADPAQARAELALPPLDGTARALVLPAPTLPDPEQAPSEYLAIVHGVPAELLARWRTEFGDGHAVAIAVAASTPPGVWLRVQPRRTDAAALAAALSAAGIATAPGPDARFLRLRDVDAGSPFATAPYRDGWFSVQDPTAFAAAAALAAQPGETILDLCAAPGGKTTALAEAMGRGRVVAYDIDGARLQQVRESVARLGLGDVVEVVDDLARAAAPANGFDGVLVDVPCSNTGVLARRVEARRRDVGQSLAQLVPAQLDLLRSACARVRPGGRVVYSTCSLERGENHVVVARVLAERGEFGLEREQLTLPRAGDSDGGYFAVLRRA